MWAAIYTYKERTKDGGKVEVVLVEADTKAEVEQYLAERPKGYLSKKARAEQVRIERVEGKGRG